MFAVYKRLTATKFGIITHHRQRECLGSTAPTHLVERVPPWSAGSLQALRYVLVFCTGFVDSVDFSKCVTCKSPSFLCVLALEMIIAGLVFYLK